MLALHLPPEKLFTHLVSGDICLSAEGGGPLGWGPAGNSAPIPRGGERCEAA